MKLLSENQLKKIADHINEHWKEFRARYPDSKYPSEILKEARKAFSTLRDPNNQIESALMWKWGHLKKANYPSAQKEVVRKVTVLWPEFVGCAKAGKRENTFAFWKRQKLGRTESFITKAFISHLVHSTEVPIIDQNNFRSLRWYLDYAGVVLSSFGHDLRLPLPKKPSRLCDIILLKVFLVEVCAYMSKEEQDLDKYMMMHGSSKAVREWEKAQR